MSSSVKSIFSRSSSVKRPEIDTENIMGQLKSLQIGGGMFNVFKKRDHTVNVSWLNDIVVFTMFGLVKLKLGVALGGVIKVRIGEQPLPPACTPERAALLGAASIIGRMIEGQGGKFDYEDKLEADTPPTFTLKAKTSSKPAQIQESIEAVKSGIVLAGLYSWHTSVTSLNVHQYYGLNNMSSPPRKLCTINVIINEWKFTNLIMMTVPTPNDIPAAIAKAQQQVEQLRTIDNDWGVFVVGEDYIRVYRRANVVDINEYYTTRFLDDDMWEVMCSHKIMFPSFTRSDHFRRGCVFYINNFLGPLILERFPESPRNGDQTQCRAAPVRPNK